MAHVIAEPCVKCKYTDCVDVCPVEAFREGQNSLTIHPDECIDCTLCVAQCPVGAIFIESDLPQEWSPWIDLNAKLSKVWPIISQSKRPPDDHAHWAKIHDKRSELSERSGDRD